MRPSVLDLSTSWLLTGRILGAALVTSACSALLPAHPNSADLIRGPESLTVSLVAPKVDTRGAEAAPPAVVKLLVKPLFRAAIRPVVAAAEAEASRYTQTYTSSVELDSGARLENGSVLLLERRVGDQTALQLGFALEHSPGMIADTFLLRPSCLFVQSSRAKILDLGLSPITWFAGVSDAVLVDASVSVDSIWKDGSGVTQRIQDELAGFPTLSASLPSSEPTDAEPREAESQRDVAAAGPPAELSITGQAIAKRYTRYCKANPIESKATSEPPLFILRTSNQVQSKAVLTIQVTERDPSRARSWLRRLIEASDDVPDRATRKVVDVVSGDG